MKARNLIAAGILIAMALYAAAEGLITTESGDLLLKPASKRVIVNDSAVQFGFQQIRTEPGYSTLWVEASADKPYTQLLVKSPKRTNAGWGGDSAYVGAITNNDWYVRFEQLDSRSYLRSNSDLRMETGGDLTVNAPGGDLFVENAWVRTRNKLGYSASGGSSFITDLLYWHHNGADGVIITSKGSIILEPASGKIKMKRPDGQYACCGPDNSNQWTCGGC